MNATVNTGQLVRDERLELARHCDQLAAALTNTCVQLHKALQAASDLAADLATVRAELRDVMLVRDHALLQVERLAAQLDLRVDAFSTDLAVPRALVCARCGAIQ